MNQGGGLKRNSREKSTGAILACSNHVPSSVFGQLRGPPVRGAGYEPSATTESLHRL